MLSGLINVLEKRGGQLEAGEFPQLSPTVGSFRFFAPTALREEWRTRWADTEVAPNNSLSTSSPYATSSSVWAPGPWNSQPTLCDTKSLRSSF